jgi:hypothetical protein
MAARGTIDAAVAMSLSLQQGSEDNPAHEAEAMNTNSSRKLLQIAEQMVENCCVLSPWDRVRDGHGCVAESGHAP